MRNNDKKIFGNWKNEHSARFNAMLGLDFVVLGMLFVHYVGESLVLAILLLGLNSLVMSAAFYYFKHPKKYHE